MTGLIEYRNIQTLESRAKELGFLLVPARAAYAGTNLMSLIPAGDRMPIYCRDAEIFSGSVEELLMCLHGWEQSINYLQLIRATSDKQIQRREQDIRNEQLVRILTKSKSKED